MCKHCGQGCVSTWHNYVHVMLKHPVHVAFLPGGGVAMLIGNVRSTNK